MNNVCECEEENDYDLKIAKATQKVEEKLTLMDLYTKLNKLELENEILKANNYELNKQNLQLRNGINVLHNKLNEKYQEQYEESMLNEDISYMDKYAEGNEELLAKMYEVTSNDYKFGGHDLKE